jgi:hypothetical protein
VEAVLREIAASCDGINNFDSRIETITVPVRYSRFDVHIPPDSAFLCDGISGIHTL